jgi:hypothetical protein
VVAVVSEQERLAVMALLVALVVVLVAVAHQARIPVALETLHQ